MRRCRFFEVPAAVSSRVPCPPPQKEGAWASSSFHLFHLLLFGRRSKKEEKGGS